MTEFEFQIQIIQFIFIWYGAGLLGLCLLWRVDQTSADPGKLTRRALILFLLFFAPFGFFTLLIGLVAFLMEARAWPKWFNEPIGGSGRKKDQ